MMRGPMAFAFITLTLLDGTPMAIESLPGVVSIIRPGHGQCHRNATAIFVAGRGLCVKESREQIEKLLKDANTSKERYDGRD
jgi:hypothetical protein